MTAQSQTPVTWLHGEDGDFAYRMGRQGPTFVAEWPIARLTCREDGSHARLTRTRGASPREVAKLRGVVKALMTDLRGGLGLHASAVALGRRGVLMLGGSGAGKSTAAAGLCLRRGARLLADDAALVEERRGVVQVTPSEERHYLTRESGDALGLRLRTATPEGRWKAAVRPGHAATRRVPLALVVALRFDDALQGVEQRPLRGADAALRMLGAMFRFDLSDRRCDLDRVMRVYQQVRFVEIVRPRSRPDVVDSIVSALGGQGGQ